MIVYKSGNLFCSKAEAYAHGCNTIGKMNAGIARKFKDKYPEMYKDYKEKCRKSLFLPGQGYIYYNINPPHVINLATQGHQLAEINYVESALHWLKNHYREIGINSVALLKIASGLGGLDWRIAKEMIEKEFNDSDLIVEIWSLN